MAAVSKTAAILCTAIDHVVVRVPIRNNFGSSGVLFHVSVSGDRRNKGLAVTDIIKNCWKNARVLREGLEKMGRFDIVSKEVGVPLVAFSLKDSSKHTVFEIADSLRKFARIIPAYTMPADAEHVAVLRVVIREDFSRSLTERLISSIKNVTAERNAEGTVLKKSILETEQEIL